MEISHNNVSYNDGNGMEIYDCDRNKILNNSITNNEGAGISCGESKGSVIENNDIADNDGNGIELWDFDESAISDNTVANNGYIGLNLGYTSNTSITNNIIAGNNNNGIDLWDSSNNSLSGNTVLGNYRYGISLDASTEDIEVTRNDFIGNNAGEDSQAYDSGAGNLFSHNHWDDWTIDRNTDGVVDQPYNIDGEANSRDPYPQAWSVFDPTFRISSNILIGVILLILTLIVLFLLIRKQTRA